MVERKHLPSEENLPSISDLFHSSSSHHCTNSEVPRLLQLAWVVMALKISFITILAVMNPLNF